MRREGCEQELLSLDAISHGLPTGFLQAASEERQGAHLLADAYLLVSTNPSL